MGPAFLIPALISAAGAGVQAVNQNQANNRAQTAQTQAIIDQQQKQSAANSAVNAMTQKIANSSVAPQKAQATSNLINTLRQNMAGSSTSNPESALAPITGGSARYNADNAAGQASTTAYGNNLADELGTIQGTTQERTQEGTGMNTLGVNLNGLNAASQSQAFVDQLRASIAGQQNPYGALASNLLTKGASAYAANTPDPNSIYNLQPVQVTAQRV